MAKQIVASEESLAPILSRFTEVILIDSSVIALPDSEKSEFRGCGGSYGANQAATPSFCIALDGKLNCCLNVGNLTGKSTNWTAALTS